MRPLSKLTIFLALAATGFSQETATFSTDTKLVLLHATVVDNKGHLIPDLKQDAFRVFENNVEQKLKVFRREDVPVSVGMVIDNSGSMNDKRKHVEAASLKGWQSEAPPTPDIEQA